MQGQESTSDAIPGTSYPDYGSNAINFQPNDNNAIRPYDSGHHGHDFTSWIDENANAILNSDLPIRYEDLLAEGGILNSPSHANVGTDLRFEQMHLDHNIDRFQHSGNINLGDRHLPNETSVLQRASSSEYLNCLDSPAAFEGNDVYTILRQNSYGQGELNADSPDSTEYVSEDEESGEGYLSEAPPRNTWPRRIPHQNDFVPANMPMLIARNPNMQPTVYNPYDFNLYDLGQNRMSAAAVVHPTRSLVYTPTLETYQPFQLNATTSSWPGMPFSPAHIAHEIDAFLYAESLRNNLTPALQLSENQLRNFAGMAVNQDYANGTYFLGNMAFSSYNIGSSHAYQPSALTWTPQGYMARQYEQNFAEMFNYTWPWGQGGSGLEGDLDLSMRGGNSRSSHQVPLMPGLTVRTERQSSPAPQRRTTIASEVHNTLALVHRDGYLQIEEVVVIEHSVLSTVTDDSVAVDSMSYEELLDLEEQIGSVATGVIEDAILALLKRGKYQSIVATGSAMECEICCICQEEFVDGEDLGKLNCKHDFHFDCIKQWLLEKNKCPLCKSKALDV